MKASERLLDYVSVWTMSDEQSETVPSAKREFDLAEKLVKELHEIGVSNAEVDDKCYVYASIPATEGLEDKPVIGFIAHVDTSPEFPGKDIKPQIIENYDGKDVVLGTSGRVLTAKDFPNLPGLAGRTLITTDGTTLLGADDKAGIAEIMTALEEIIKEGIPHGKICVAFTPDEEIARGAEYFDVERFGAQYGYTLDGWQEGEIQYENFHASTAVFTAQGVNVHPGSAKDIMVNAQLLAMEINSMIPANETPATTEGYEGFYHLQNSEGSVDCAKLTYMVRDFDRDLFDKREEFLQDIAVKMNEKYGKGMVELVITQSYRNMKEMVEPCFHLIDNAVEAIKRTGIEPEVTPIRGGTDGARLSFNGLPCPNLGTGGYGYHGPYEHVTVEAMDKVVEITKEIIKIYASC